MSAHLELTVIDSLEGLEELRGSWHSLALRNAETTPFQLPEWLISWSRFFDRGKLCVLGLWRNSRLSGLIPMAISTGARPNRKLVLMGSSVSDYLDALLEPGLRVSDAAKALASLESLAVRWDLCELGRLRSHSALFEVSPPSNCNGAIVLEEPCQILQLTGKPRDLDQAIPPHQSANVRCYRMCAQRRGAIGIKSADPINLESLLDDFMKLYKPRWPHIAGKLAKPAVEAFFRTAAREMLAIGNCA